MPDAHAQGYYEPSLTIVMLPRCPQCETKHPLAYDPPRDPSTCPQCKGPAAEPGEEVTLEATFTGEPQ